MSNSSATLWTVAHQAPLSMGFPRQEYWSGLSFASPTDLPNPGTESAFPAMAGGFLTTEPPGKPYTWLYMVFSLELQLCYKSFLPSQSKLVMWSCVPSLSTVPQSELICGDVYILWALFPKVNHVEMCIFSEHCSPIRVSDVEMCTFSEHCFPIKVSHVEMCTFSEHCSDSPWFSSSDGDLKGAQKSVCLHSGQDELCECHFPPLVTGHRFQSVHAKHLNDYLATWQIPLWVDLELMRCNFCLPQS